MAGNDAFIGLAALASKVKSERQLLLERLKSFEKKLVESSHGVGCRGASTSVTLYHWDDEASGVSSSLYGWLVFDGSKLIVRTEQHADGWGVPDWKDYAIEDVEPDWQVMLSKPAIMNSLIADMARSLEDEHVSISTTNEWLSEFVAAEKALIDADLDEQFEHSPTLLELWQKARTAVEVDPEESIGRSCSHVETILKACLKQLGDVGYEKATIQNLYSRTIKILRDSDMVDEAALQALTGINTIFHGIGTLRNSSSTAHGKNDGYTPPGPDLAQLINHLAGVGSAFIIKQTEKVVQAKQKPE